MHIQNQYSTRWDIYNKVESGLDDPNDVGHLSDFLMSQVGLIHKLNYPDMNVF